MYIAMRSSTNHPAQPIESNIYGIDVFVWSNGRQALPDIGLQIYMKVNIGEVFESSFGWPSTGPGHTLVALVVRWKVRKAWRTWSDSPKA